MPGFRMFFTTVGLFLAVLSISCSEESNPVIDGDEDTAEAEFVGSTTDLLPYVDPLIGSAGSGNVIVGALRPHGFVRVGPATHEEPGEVASYRFDTSVIDGFAHTFLEGPGGSGNGYGQILLVPLVDDVEVHPDGYAQAFDHADEQAEAGYYAVTLDNGVHVELTAGGFSAIHRYQYPSQADATVVLDLGYSRGDSIGGLVEIVDEHTIEGLAVYDVHPILGLLLSGGNGSTGESTIYFHIETSAAMISSGVFHADDEEPLLLGATDASGARIGAFARFGALDEPLLLRVGLSRISIEQAQRNLEAEQSGLGFDELYEDTAARWNQLLNRVQVTSDNDGLKKIFYTALYHSLFQPTDLTESDDLYFDATDGFGSTGDAEGWQYYGDDWCMWDTFRTLHPLGTLVEPEIRSDVVRSLLASYESGGWLPKCSWQATGYSRVMIANPAVPIIVDAYVKGFDDFDVDLAYEAILKSSMEDDDNPMKDAMCGYLNLGTPSEYRTFGYVSHECDKTQSVSMTLEYAQDDFCVARMAEALGKTEDAQLFDDRAQNYRNHWNADEGFMVPLNRDGSWVTPFDPADTSDFNDFCEASSWIYSWYVPHDVPGLIELIGGKEATVAKLDAFFDGGHFDVGNEPSFHIPYLYSLAGRPDLSQERIDTIWRESFSVAPDGLPGNDDSGAMSAYAAFLMLGLYPISPGEPRYLITTPAFSHVELRLHPEYFSGESFEIVAEGLSESKIFIQAASLNGDPLDTLEITHDQIIAGGNSG